MDNLFVKSDWVCIPKKSSKNKNVIFFAASNAYSFAVSNVIMGLKQHSPDLMEKSDVLIFSTDMNENNKRLLQKLGNNIFFPVLSFPEQWRDMVEHPSTQRWGLYIVCAFYGFWLVKQYEKALWVDADVLIRGDISELFEIESPLAWRSLRAWDPNKVFASLIVEGRNITCPSGGLILFTEKLNDFEINETSIAGLFKMLVDSALYTRGGCNEVVVGLLAYLRLIEHKELDIQVYNTSVKNADHRTKIVHFFAIDGVLPKPWKSLASYLYFTDWAEYYQKWIDMGGDGPINYTKDDYYKLFGFGKAASPKNPKEYKALEAKYNAIRNSKSWKLTAPLRKCAKWFRKLMKKFKKQH